MKHVDRFELIGNLDVDRIVIKIGSSMLSDSTSRDGLNFKTLKMLSTQIKSLVDQNKKVLLVSSGAVNTGKNILATRFDREIQTRPAISRKQALSAIGQIPLMACYAELFASHQIPVAQVLITAQDFLSRRSYLNIGHTLDELLNMGVLPIINENDTVVTDELQFGENDLLSAAIAALFKADLLIILTSVEGFLLDGKRISQITNITSQYKQAAGGPAGPGSGGMITKLRAGALSQRCGIPLAILPGFHENPVGDLFLQKDIGTFIYKDQDLSKIRARKKWLLFAQTQGAVYLDPGAVDALLNKGSSLLLAGVKSLSGKFYSNEVVDIFSASNEMIGRGVCNYSSRQMKQFLKLRQKENQNHTEHGKLIIHRDNLVMENDQSV